MASGGRGPSPRVLLTLLLLAYILNFLDRQILGILAGPIIGELKLTDTQFGILSGPPFALLYSVLGIPFAYLADRTSRSRVIAASLGAWSAFTALCGGAASFAQLFVFRMGVGIGEAGGVAPSYALISDYFAPHQRARALAIFSLGIPLGSAAGTIVGAYLASWINWRAAFYAMGIAGLVLTPLFLVTVRDVPRPDRRSIAPPQLSQVFSILVPKPSFWLMALAASCSSLAGYGLLAWTPSVLERSFGLTLIQRGQFFASLLLVGGTAGILAGGWLADRLGRKRRAWYAWLPAIAWIVTAPTFALGLMAPNLLVAWPLLLIPNALNILWLGPVITAVQHLVPQRLRASASAAFLLINNLIGLGIGPFLIGRLSDAMKHAYGTESLRHAAIASTGFYVAAAVLMFLASFRLSKDWVDDTATV